MFRHYQTFNVFNAQYPKLTPPAVRSNTDYAILFNTDYLPNMEEYWQDFAGKMDRHAFYAVMREFTERVPHGFLCIDNDPNIPYDQKFYYGLAEELPFDIDHIFGCEEMWKESYQQLVKIANGTMQEQIDRIAKISKPDGIYIPPENNGELGSMDDRERPTWDTSRYLPGAGGSDNHKMGVLL